MLMRNKRGAIAAAILSLILATSLSANLLANDRPLILDFRGKIYSPVIQNLSGQTFGPTFLPTLADYQNPEIKAAIRAHGWMIFPLIPYSYDTIVRTAPPAPAPPSAQDWLGTDAVSRDVLARILYGLRTSLLFGFVLTFAASAIGIAAGAIQGYYGGLTDLLFQRFSEIWSGLPQVFLIIILASFLVPGFWTLLLILLAFSWMTLTNRVRAEFLHVRNFNYVTAARILGVPDWQIILRHILPDALVAVTTFLPFILAESIALLASLDYLGFGLPAGAPSLGELITEAKNNPQAPWLGIAIFTTLAGVLLLLIFIGETLRDTLSASKQGQGALPPRPPPRGNPLEPGSGR
jgi:microcin C transport system permease protein